MKQFISIALILLSSTFGWGQSSVVDSLLHQGYQRKYTIHLPLGYNRTSLVPVVIMLHGGGGTMQNAQPFTNLNAVADAKGFLAVYPQGYTEVQNGYSWADGRGTAADLAGIDDVGFLDNLLNVLVKNYAADTNRIYLCGFSK